MRVSAQAIVYSIIGTLFIVSFVAFAIGFSLPAIIPVARAIAFGMAAGAIVGFNIPKSRVSPALRARPAIFTAIRLGGTAVFCAFMALIVVTRLVPMLTVPGSTNTAPFAVSFDRMLEMQTTVIIPLLLVATGVAAAIVTFLFAVRDPRVPAAALTEPGSSAS
jgi:hypothetical protein